MAITRAQQFRQMLEDGGMLVQPSKDGKRPGYRSAKAQEVQGRTKTSGFSAPSKPGQSPRGTTTSKDDDVAPGYNPNTGRFERPDGTPEPSRTPEQVQQSLDAATAQGRFDKKSPVRRFMEQYTGNTRRALYNFFDNNPRNELDYLRSLPDSQKALLSPSLRAKLEELEDAERFDDIDSVYNTKFTFNEFEDLRKFQPTDDTLNFAEYAAKFKGSPGLLYSGDVGGLITIKNPDGTFRYERRSDDDSPSGESDLDRRLRLLEEQNAALRDQAAAAGAVGTSPFFRLMADGGMTNDAPIEGGIMDLESARQMMFLGGIVKGLKKIGKSATRAIKKVAKSPIGKAALLGIGGSFALGLGPFASGSTMFGGKLAGLKGSGFLKSAGLKDFFIKDGALTGKGISTLLLGAPFIGDILNLNKPKEEPDLYAGPKLDFNAQLYNRFMADGGRVGFQEGGGIEQRLEKLGGDVSSAEQMLQGINKRLETAESSLGSGGGLGGLPAGIANNIMPQLPDNPLANTPLPSMDKQVKFDSIKEDPYARTILAGLSQDGQRFDSAQSAFDALAEQTRQAREKNPFTRNMIGTELFQGAEGFKNFTNLFNQINNPGFVAPSLQLASQGSLGIPAAGYAEGGKAEPVAKKTMPLLDLDGQEMDFRAEGGFVPIGRMEKADDVPARLSKNEFVFTAEAVRNAGGGDVDKGAEVMYNTMKNLEAGGEMSDESQGLNGARNMFQTAQRLGEVI